MSKPAPRLAGYTPEVHYDCPSCGELVRVIYRQTSKMVDKENPHSFQGFWRESRFGGGTVVDTVSHAANAYPYGQACPWRLPPESNPQPAHFVDMLYQNMIPYWQRQKAKHIIRCDAAKFLAGPWCLTTPAREPDVAPIVMVVQSYAMPFVIKNGRVPNIRTEPYNFGTDEQLRLADEFAARIDAVMDDI